MKTTNTQKKEGRNNNHTTAPPRHTPTGEGEQVADFVKWMGEQPHRHKIFIAGNHDVTMHRAYYESKGQSNLTETFHQTCIYHTPNFDRTPLPCAALLLFFVQI